MTPDRDVRLTREQAAVLADAAGRRSKILRRSIAADSGTFHNALRNKQKDLEDLKQAADILRVAIAAMDRQTVENIRRSLGDRIGHPTFPDRSPADTDGTT